MLAILKKELLMTEISYLPLKERMVNYFGRGRLFGENLNIVWNGKSVILSKVLTPRSHYSEM